jgi:hypothetical protein
MAGTSWAIRVTVVVGVACGPALACGNAAAVAADYPREGIVDTTVYPDEALVNVGLAASQWPDCTTLESTMAGVFRIEGVADKSDQDKALALWKWFRLMVSATGGGYVYEGASKDRQKMVLDPHKIFAVYGHHQCDGMSWAYVSLWRAAGFLALDECTLGHTIASLRYRDADGLMRFHDFDPQGRFYYWDDVHQRVGTWSMPLLRGRVHRHIMQPQNVHSLRTSLRWGETIERNWQNTGHVVPPGKPGSDLAKSDYYVYAPGKRGGVFAAVGEEVQTFAADTTPAGFARSLSEGSQNTACSGPAPGTAALHPKTAGTPATFIYRLAPPYVAVDGRCEATLVKGAADDVCRLALSVDGGPWQTIFEKQTVGEEPVTVDLGRAAFEAGKPNVYSTYDVRIKAEFSARKDVETTGMNRLQVVLWRQLNKRALPQLRPGDNVLRLTADRIAPGLALELRLRYRVRGEAREVVRTVSRFPYAFDVNLPGVRDFVLKNYDKDFNGGDVQMESIRMRLATAPEVAAAPASLDETRVAAAFARAYPHPCDLTDRKIMKVVETDVIQTNGFFPQSRVRIDDARETMDALVKTLKTGGTTAQWAAAEDLGNYPAAVDVLIAELPRANIDLTLFIVKALAQIGDKKAVPALVAKWKREAPGGAPGARYIPDALAVLGDRSVVPDLIQPLKDCRFDMRFHVAYALGILGGPEAEAALKDLAENDPFPPIRELARDGLERKVSGTFFAKGF